MFFCGRSQFIFISKRFGTLQKTAVYSHAQTFLYFAKHLIRDALKTISCLMRLKTPWSKVNKIKCDQFCFALAVNVGAKRLGLPTAPLCVRNFVAWREVCIPKLWNMSFSRVHWHTISAMAGGPFSPNIWRRRCCRIKSLKVLYILLKI